MLEDAQATVLLTREEMLDRLPEFAGIVVDLDAQEEEMSRQSSENPIPICAAENLMYVVYTSGSTGKPKGVGGTHRSMVNRLAWMERLFPVAEDERCCQKTSLGFIDAATEIFGPLVHGASLLIIGDSVVRDAKQLVELLAEHGITRMVLVPSLLRALLASEADPGRRLESLRMVVSSGEALGKDLAHLFRETMPQAHLLNFYGSSEVAGDATWYEASGCGTSDRVLIGQPMDNVEAYVLNEELEPVPVGMTGELYIGGAGLARGYLNRADLTAEKFVPNCFSRVAGERLYRTGDHARWQAKGRLEFLGRRDHQVKIRGYRIELGEIEAALLEHEDLDQAVVVIDAEQRLVGYVVRKTGAEKLQTSQLRSYLKERLPEYMVPSAFVQMEALPLTSSGKVDRKALPKPEYATSEDLTGACTPEEEILCGIFAEVLRLDRVGMKQNFFEAGGHSLLATRVISRIRNTFNVELPLRALFEAPTVAGLAERMSGLRGAGQLAAPPIKRVSREGDLPLSFAQQRLWFLHQLEPESVAYNMPFGIRLSGELERQVLSKSLNELVRRHEVLRTHFVLKDSGAVQVITAEVELKIKEIDLRGMAEAEREGEALRLGQEEAVQPFDLGRGSLVRVKLLQLAEQEHVLLVTMHHIVSDGWSHRNHDQRAQPALPSVCEGGRVAVGGVGGAVWGLCGVAAGVAAGRGAGGAAEVLEETAGGDGAFGPADRSSAACGDESARSSQDFHHRKATERAAEGAITTRRGDVVHGAAGGIAGDVEQVYGAGGYRGGDGGGEPEPGGSGRADRVLCEHAGAEDGGGRECEFERGGETGEGGDAGSVPEPGCAVREAGGGVAAGEGFKSVAVVPGDAGAAEQ